MIEIRCVKCKAMLGTTKSLVGEMTSKCPKCKHFNIIVFDLVNGVGQFKIDGNVRFTNKGD